MTRASPPYRPGLPIVPELAAGVVLVSGRGTEVFLLHHRAEDRWCLPKGHVEAGESLETAALRETREETGFVRVRLLGEIDHVAYRFFRDDRHENVYKAAVYFLATTDERTAQLEPIFDRGEWCSFADAIARVPYDTDRRVLTSAQGRGFTDP